MAKLKVDINTMNSAANTLKKAREELDAIIEEYQGIVTELSTTWDGAASAEFISRLQAQITELQGVQLSMIGIETYSKSVATAMMAIDKVLTELLKGIMPV